MLGRGAYAPPPPPPSRSKLGIVLIGLVAICLLAGVGLVAVKLLGGDTQVAAEYQNEDYTPPAAETNPDQIPIPTTQQELEQWLTQNRLYDQTVPVPVRCDVGRLDPTSATVSQAEKHLNDLTGCLMRVWDRTLQAADWTLPRPTVTFYSGSVTTKCGTSGGKNAFYCGGDQQLYFADDVLTILPVPLQSSPVALDLILAHEFGHHIQGRTGIFAASRIIAQNLSKSEANAYSRRTELQADCLAGEFVRSVGQSRSLTDADHAQMGEIMAGIGDDVLSNNPNVDGDHGHGRNRKAWGELGMTSDSVGACNTFTAPADSVR